MGEPLPSFTPQALSTNRVSPMLSRKAPGAQTSQKEVHSLKMSSPKAMLLPFPGAQRDAFDLAGSSTLGSLKNIKGAGSLGESRLAKQLARLSSSDGLAGKAVPGEVLLAEPP